MSRPLSHTDYEELLGAFALDAVDDAESAAVELHLLDCPRCRAEVARHRETAGLLGYAGALAPEGLWERIAGELREAPPALTLVRASAGAASAGTRGAGSRGLAGAGSPGLAGAGPPGGHAVRSLRQAGADASIAAARWRRRVSVRPVAALAGVAALVIGLLGFEISNLQGQVAQVRQSVNSGSLQNLADVALSTPGHETVTMNSPLNKELATAVIAPDGQGYLIDAKLAKLAPNQTYQLWGLTGDTPISLGLLGNAPKHAPFDLNFSKVSELMITVEPEGGVPQPDSPAVVTGKPVVD
ncbi:MAG: anti-sigma factor domain-containing protein [Acidimicrobiales bacterium]